MDNEIEPKDNKNGLLADKNLSREKHTEEWEELKTSEIFSKGATVIKRPIRTLRKFKQFDYQNNKNTKKKIPTKHSRF